MLWRKGLWAQRIFFVWLLAAACPSSGWAQSVDARAQGMAHFIMAVCDDLNGRETQAVKEYQKSINFDGSQAIPRLKLGIDYLALNQLRRATSQLKQAVRLSPQNSQAHYLLALIYSAEHKYKPATSELEVLLQLASKEDPSDTDAYMFLGQLYYAQGQYDQAIEQFSKIVRLQPSNTSALFLLGSVYADNNNTSAAIPIFRQLLQMDPDNSEALNSLSYMYAVEGIHLDQAVSMVQKALKGDPKNGAYWDTLGWALYKKGKYAESLQALQKAQKYIEDEVLYEHIGDVYEALKDEAKACTYWHKSLRMDPTQASVQQKIKAAAHCGRPGT